jgi:ribosomal protein S18 acetylase RimI-like enzyme
LCYVAAGPIVPGFFMEIGIRAAQPDDLATVIKMMREFAAYEKLLDSLNITEERLHDAVFGKESFVEILIATGDDIPAGYALFYPCFASFRSQRGLYLEDIYVSSEYRGRGIGEAMLREIARIGHSQGCERIDFQVLEWNTAAISFYKKLGAVCNDEERHFKFSDEVFLNLAS